jgi:hypothetical protein
LCVGGEGGGWCTSPERSIKAKSNSWFPLTAPPPEMGQSGNVSGGVALVYFFCLFLL